MTATPGLLRYCHCEERSDVAIAMTTPRYREAEGQLVVAWPQATPSSKTLSMGSLGTMAYISATPKQVADWQAEHRPPLADGALPQAASWG